MKKKLFKKHKQFPAQQSLNDFSSARRVVKKLLKRDNAEYIKNAQHSLLHDPKYFWSFIKEKKGHTIIPSNVYLDDNSYDNPMDVVNGFARLFCSSFNRLEDSSNYCVNASYSGLSINISILNEDILKAIKKCGGTITRG